jgi:hypothetical protein
MRFFPCFFLICKANARVQPHKDGARPALFQNFFVVLRIRCFLSFSVLLVCKLYCCHRMATKLQLTNTSYHIMSCHISYHIMSYIISYVISYHISCHIISYPNIQKPTACHNICNLCAKMACSSFELIFTFLYAGSSLLNAPSDSFLVSTCLFPTLPFFQSHKQTYNGIRYEDSRSYFSVIIQN